MSDFSKDVAGRLKQKEENARIAAQKSIQDHQTLVDGCGRLWGRLREVVSEMTNEVNNEPGISIHLDFENNPPTRIVLSRHDTGEMLVGDLNATERAFSFRRENGAPYSVVVKVVLTADGKDVYLAVSGSVPTTPEHFAAKLIHALLGIS
ncbi:MAG: hypothetical protein ACLPND_05370 [Candidatus Korobacteraceae bacterium]